MFLENLTICLILLYADLTLPHMDAETSADAGSFSTQHVARIFFSIHPMKFYLSFLLTPALVQLLSDKIIEEDSSMFIQ